MIVHSYGLSPSFCCINTSTFQVRLSTRFRSASVGLFACSSSRAFVRSCTYTNAQEVFSPPRNGFNQSHLEISVYISQTLFWPLNVITFTCTYTAFKLQFLHFDQLLLSQGTEPMILVLLTPCSTIWATWKLKYNNHNHIIIVKRSSSFTVTDVPIAQVDRMLA